MFDAAEVLLAGDTGMTGVELKRLRFRAGLTARELARRAARAGGSGVNQRFFSAFDILKFEDDKISIPAAYRVVVEKALLERSRE